MARAACVASAPASRVACFALGQEQIGDTGMAKFERRPATTTTVSPRAKSKTASPPTMRGTPSEQQIRARAYEIYLRRNGGPGDAHADWAQAERELRQELSR